MKIIGITGGIGTGKSTILRYLEEKHHAHIVETDSLAHRLMAPGQCAYHKIVEHFGSDILMKDGTIDRSKLGAIVFQKEEELLVLNGIVHPFVKEFILKEIEQKKREHTPIYVIESALLIEAGYRPFCDQIWYVYANHEQRIARLLAGRGGNREKWESIISKQSSEDYYKQNCDYIIENMDVFEKTADIIEDLLCKTL